MSAEHTCPKGCCTIKIKNYTYSRYPTRRGNCKKAGVFFYDSKEKRVLLVQSKGHLWGPPKGSLEVDINETEPECAIREAKEETGIDVTLNDFKKCTMVNGRAVYYYVERDYCPVDVQNHDNLERNDANGITWIKIDCLEDCIVAGSIVLNKHSKKVFSDFLCKTFPKCDFILVENKKKKRRESD